MSVDYSKAQLDHLNYEYSPSEHTKRFKSGDEAIQAHLEVIDKETNKVRNECGFEIEFNVKYGPDEEEILDIYYKKTTAKDAPLFIYIHGGYWQMLTKDTSAYCVEQLVTAGYRVLIIDYSLCPKVTLTQLINQIQNCIKFCFNYAAKNESKFVSVCGHSAGAHLILAALSNVPFWISIENKEALKYLYLVSGVYDLTEIRHLSSVNDKNILGLNDQNIKEVSPLFSNYSHLKPYNIVFNVIVGEYDSKVFQRHSKDISERLISDTNEKHCSHTVLKDIDHFNIVENLRQSDYWITQQIIKDGGFI